jgi:hypothetical protein
MPKSRLLSATGFGCLGALLGTLSGLIIAGAIAARQFDADFKQQSAETEARAEAVRQEQEKLRKEQGKTHRIKEALAQAAGNGAAAALSPPVAASFLFVAKVIGGGVLGLIGGTVLGTIVGLFRGAKGATPASEADGQATAGTGQ